jgi:hypothetical protein
MIPSPSDLLHPPPTRHPPPPEISHRNHHNHGPNRHSLRRREWVLSPNLLTFSPAHSLTIVFSEGSSMKAAQAQTLCWGYAAATESSLDQPLSELEVDRSVSREVYHCPFEIHGIGESCCGCLRRELLSDGSFEASTPPAIRLASTWAAIGCH